jgi:hypothetical protein
MIVVGGNGGFGNLGAFGVYGAEWAGVGGTMGHGQQSNDSEDPHMGPPYCVPAFFFLI